MRRFANTFTEKCQVSVDIAYAINDAGEIVGQSCTDQAVRFSLTGYAERHPVGPASALSAAEAINQRGDIAGYAGTYAFLYKDHKTLYLPVPTIDQAPGVNSVAFGINASGEIVGNTENWQDGEFSAFVYVGGRSYDLNTLLPPKCGWRIIDVVGINDHGETVANGYYNGNCIGVSLEPPK